jgi:hypothetical protein
MKRLVNIFLIIGLLTPGFARVIKSNKKLIRIPGKKPAKVVEPVYIPTHGADHVFGPKTQYNNRDSDFVTTLIDSSLNGYGCYNPTPNPLGYAFEEGYSAVYRQFQGLYTEGGTAGYIGASQSEDGIEWFTEQKLNTRYPSGEEEPNLPTADGLPQGRYPSAGFGPGGYPTAIWNEYTNSDQGGGTYGGMPLYTYDSQGVGEFSSWVNPFYVNNGCNTTPCDPADLWVGNVYVNSGNGTPRLTGLYNGWADTPTNYYFITSNFLANGYFLMNDAYVMASDGDQGIGGDYLWYDFGNYTSAPDYHLNDEGIGYMAQVSYSLGSDEEEPFLHTFFFKKTEDFGETWTSDGGYLGSGYNYINDATLIRLSDSLHTMHSNDPELYPEQLWYPWAECDSVDVNTGDTITTSCGDSIYYSNIAGPNILTPGWFFYYDFDLRTDVNGGMHLITEAVPMVCPDSIGGCVDNDNNGLADSLYNEARYGSAGHLHLFNPNPIDEPNNWTATLLNDLSETYYADWGVSDIPHINSDAYPAMYYFYPEITLSGEEDSEVMWYGGFEGSGFTWNEDSTLYFPTDIDLYMRKSVDAGKTWTDLENVSNTPGGIYPDKNLEVSLHLAQSGSDDEVGLFYQVPDFYTETIPPSTGYEDYMNRVYVGIYTNDAEGSGNVGLDSEKLTPDKFTLKQNYPNPFNPVTQIQYDLAKAGNVVLDLFDIRGAKVKTLMNEQRPAGTQNFTLDGTQLASGVYFYSMTKNGITQTRKLVLMK